MKQTDRFYIRELSRRIKAPNAHRTRLSSWWPRHAMRAAPLLQDEATLNEVVAEVTLEYLQRGQHAVR